MYLLLRFSVDNGRFQTGLQYVYKNMFEHFKIRACEHYCRNGAERSGLLCVVSVVLERMKVEQDVAIGHVIEELRSCREQLIPTLVRLC